MGVPDSKVVPELTFGGQSVADFFLVDGLVCCVNARGELMGCAIDDPELAVAATAYLRRVGVPEYSSMQAYFERCRAQPSAAGDADSTGLR